MIRPAPYRFALQVLAVIALLVGLLAAGDRLLPVHAPALVQALPNAPRDLTLLAGSDGQVVYLGDSVVTALGAREPDQRPLYQMLAERLERPVALASHPANAMDTYRAQLEYLVRSGAATELVIVPINLRSFAPPWESIPGYDFALANRMYEKPLSTRAAAVFKRSYTAPKRLLSLADVPVWVDGRRVASLATFRPAGLARDHPDAIESAYRLNYTTDVEHSDGLAELQRLARVAADWRRPVLLYLTPIDFARMADYLGSAGIERAERNLARLLEAVTTAGLEPLDLSHSVGPGGFHYPAWNPNEHLNATGRAVVAEALAERARRLYGANER
jgi:lysophospholipase L1-like esterase